MKLFFSLVVILLDLEVKIVIIFAHILTVCVYVYILFCKTFVPIFISKF